MKTRFYAAENPHYPAKGQRRYGLWRVDRRNGVESVRMIPAPQFTSKRSAERRACELQVTASFAELGIAVAENER